jgi:hypothetical protein
VSGHDLSRAENEPHFVVILSDEARFHHFVMETREGVEGSAVVFLVPLLQPSFRLLRVTMKDVA